MTAILHLLPRGEWETLGTDAAVTNASLAEVGFIHCTDDHGTLLRVANMFYASDPQPYVVLHVDTELLTSPCVWEAPAHPAPTSDDFESRVQETLFPHVYGTINRGAIVDVHEAIRSADGRFERFD